ncbi:MAG: response regulator [Bdellovibrionota bacterium]
MNEKSVLVVDDQKNFREAVAFEMEMLGFKTDLAEDGYVGYERAKSSPYSVIISDIRMPNWDGVKLLEEIRKLSPNNPPMILMTGFADTSISKAYDMGVDAFLDKPLNPENFEKIINTLLISSSEQFQRTTLEKPNSQIHGNTQYLEIGRRGFFLGHVVDPAKYNLGELIDFDLTVENPSLSIKKIKGLGTIRWIRPHNEEGQLPGIGVEIFNLIEPDLKIFLDYVHSNQIIATIPYDMRFKKIEIKGT